MRIRAGLPVGVNAAFFDEAKRVRTLEARLCERTEGAGFSEVLLPILDYYAPYEELLGERLLSGSEADQLYRFVDRDGQLLALRYDFTPMLARLVAPRLASWQLPIRLYYRGDVVRHQEPRPGLLRESAQFGAEILDRPDASHEQEILELFVDLLLRGLDRNARSLHVVLGLSGALDTLIAGAADPVIAAQAVARRDRHAARLAGEALLQVVIDGAPQDPSCLGAAAARLETLFGRRERLLESLGDLAGRKVRVSIDLAEFASFGGGAQEGEHPYYDGLVFRAYLEGSARPVGNGGRYDGLFRALGAEVSAAGFSLGLDGLLEAAS